MPHAAPVTLERRERRYLLRRYPTRPRDPLQAWCAADLLLLEAAAESGISPDDTLVVNDEHGALATVLQPRASWTDSALAATALAHNLSRNQLPPVPVHWSTDSPGGDYSLVLLRVPKKQAYFEYQLARLQQCLSPGTTLVCGGMDKHLSPHTASLIERYFGEVRRHRGERKARLFSARRNDAPPANTPPRSSYFCEELEASLVTGANLFSQDGLDMGTRFLLQQLSRLERVASGADLACGNGTLGLYALKAGLCREMTFADESAMAIAATRDNARSLPFATGRVHFLHGDGLRDAKGRFELILCNPPFHLGHTVDEFAGKRLLKHCAGALLPGGSLCVVANQHLPYQSLLQRNFAAVEELARNRKFRVWLARRAC